MVAVSTQTFGMREDGKQIIQAVIIADETPTELPITGDGIVGMSVDDCFAPMSIIYVTANVDTKIYIANESGVFVAQE
jgi:hypothetical protein